MNTYTVKANRAVLIEATKAALLLFGALTLMGCQADMGSVTLGSSATGARSANAAANTTAMNIATTGAIYTDSTQQVGFQQAVAGLVSTDMPESSLGSVSARWSDGTGVAFGGKISLQNGQTLAAAGAWGVNAISPNSLLKIVVYHSNQQVSGQPLLTFSQSTGYIQGQTVYVKFYDDYGAIEMTGTFNNARFQGSIKYANLLKWDGTRPGVSGDLGAFDIAACDMFRCN